MSYRKRRLYKFKCFECGKQDEETKETLLMHRVPSKGHKEYYLCTSCFWEKEKERAQPDLIKIKQELEKMR